MPTGTKDIPRRGVLRAAGALGVLGAGGTGVVAGDDTVEVNVGYARPSGRRAARDEAKSVRREFNFDALTIRVSREGADRLSRRGDVRYVEENGEMRALAQTLPWGVDRVDADVLHGENETGRGADIAIIDTGIDDDHPDLEANIGDGRAFVKCRGPTCNYDWSDDNDHGTHCAGIADAAHNSEGVVGVSTEATLHAVKVLDKRGSGSFSDVAAGIEYTADQGWDVGSLSLGASSGSQTVKDACRYAYDNGVLLVAAAGNDGPCTDCVGYPAAYEECIAVSSTDGDDSLSNFSSTGPEVELAAPGGTVYSTVVGGYDTFSGTSMACPHVSGAGGQLMANGYTNTEARQRLRDAAEDISLVDNEQGHGLLDAEAAVLDGSGDGGDTDAAPSVSWVNPSGGETVSGTVTVQIEASDDEDSDGSLDVTYSADGGSSRSTTYDSDSGTYVADWDTTRVEDGAHTLEATATDSAGNTSNTSITVTTDNTADTNAAPAASINGVADNSNPRWDRYEVDWSARDEDGNLETVILELLDGDGNALDSVANDVSGAAASGVDEVRSKRTGSEIVVTATDTDGVSGSDSRSA